MFGGKVRTRLDLTKASQRGESNCELPRKSKNTRELKVGERVQIRNFQDQSTKWKFGVVANKDGLLHGLIRMDSGQLWRCHTDHKRICRFVGVINRYFIY